MVGSVSLLSKEELEKSKSYYKTFQAQKRQK